MLFAASRTLAAQDVPAVDTLGAASVWSVKSLPVCRPSEEIYLPEAAAAPLSLASVLRRFTGVQVKDYGGVGGLKTVNVRSLGSEHVGVFLDGIQVDNAQNMQVDLSRFSTAEISSVALYNGHKASRLQTAKEYACGSAVYLEQAPPLLSGHAFKARLRGGWFGTVNPSVQLDKGFGRLGLRASAEYLGSNGRYRFPCFDTTLVRENGDVRSLRLETGLYGKLDGGDWRIKLYGYGSERGFPGPVIRRALGFPFSAERQDDRDLFAQGAWRQDWSERYSTALSLKYANNYTHYDSHPELNPMALPYNLHYRQQSAYLSLAQSFSVSDPWALDLSTDYQYNTLDSDVGQFVRPRRNCVTAALASRYTLESFRASASIVYLRASDSFDNKDAGGWTRKDRRRDAWMPSLTLLWKPLEWLEIGALGKRSFRLPSFYDLYYTVMGNSALEAESAAQYALDIRLSGRSGPWASEFRLSPYYNRVDNKIVAIPTYSQFRWTMLNIGVADITGLDARWALGFNRDGFEGGATLRYCFQRALDHSSPEGPTWGMQLPYIPEHSGGIILNASWMGWDTVWETQACGGRWSRSANTDDYYIEPWSISSLSLKKSFAAGRMSAGLLLDNIFDTPYQIVQGYPMPGFNAMLTLEICY